MMQASDKTILVVDDDPDVQNLLAACIKKAGFKVEIAVDGLDAIDKIQANIPDIIIVDMVMPRRSGVNLIRKLRKNEKWATIPVIVITPQSSNEFENDKIKEFEGLKTHLQLICVFKKPITPTLIINTINKFPNVDVLKQ